MLQKNTFLTVLSCLLLFSACSSINKLNPFKGEPTGIQNTNGATEYICEGNKRFSVRLHNNGNDAWLIYADHEVNLSKASSSNRYTAAAISLELNGNQTTLMDGEKIAYTGCKVLFKK